MTPTTPETPETPSRSPSVRIERRAAYRDGEAQLISVSPADCLGDLKPLTDALERPAHATPAVYGRDPLPAIDHDESYVDTLRAPAGLLTPVANLLKLAGHKVTVLRSTPPLGRPRLERLRGVLTPDRGWLELVRRHERGLVRHAPAGVDPVGLVAQVALAYPKLKLAVVVPTEDEARRVAARLRPYVPDAVWATADSAPPRAGRLAVATPYGLAHCDHQRLDVVVFADALAALGARAPFVLGHLYRARVFGALDVRATPSPRDAIDLAGLFGPYEAVVPCPGGRERPVAVVTTRLGGGPHLSPRLDGVTLKRKGLWDHDVRNRRLARLASGLSRGSLRSITGVCPALATFPGIRTRRRVVVVAANVEHAAALTRHLPGWPVALGPAASLAGMPARDVDRLNAGVAALSDRPARLIATAAALPSLDLGSFDAAVRADGGRGLPPGTSVGPVVTGRTRRALLLVDFDDRHHPALRVDARKRREAYSARGWAVDGKPPRHPLWRVLDGLPGVVR